MATITNTGLEYMAKVLNGVSTSPFIYMAIGTGTAAESTSDTALVAEISGSRKTAARGYEANYTATWSATFTNTSGSTWTVNEYGVFDAASGGHMLVRHTFSTTKNVDNGGSITITLKCPVNRSV